MPRTATKKAAGPSSKSATPKRRSSAQSSEMDQSSMLRQFFVDSLKDIYYAEKALVKALPKMQKAATTEELKQSIADHIEVTKEQVTRAEEVFEILGEKVQAKKCEAIEGLIKEGNSIIEDTEQGSLTRDVGIIMASQKIEHYEIASYGGLAQLARTLGLEDAAELLDETLAEEKEADQLLTQIAENNINVEASNEEEEEE